MRFKKIILFISLISFAAILMTSCSQWEVAGIGESEGGGPQEEVKNKRTTMSTDDGKIKNESTLNLNTNN